MPGRVLTPGMLQPFLQCCSPALLFLFVCNGEESKAFKPSINWTLTLRAMNYYLTEIHLPLPLSRNKLEEKNQLQRRKIKRLCLRDKLLMRYTGNRHEVFELIPFTHHFPQDNSYKSVAL